LPLWLGWLPTLLATLILGTLGMSLAFEWMVDATGSNVGLKLALRPDLPTSPMIDPSLIPRGGWFFSNATHMAAWAVALERANDGENHAEDVRSLLLAARLASPLAARARFNVEASDDRAAAIDPNDFSEIGRTRDVVSLMSTGRRLRESGKVESSIRAYRSAMEMALRADRAGLDPPVFDESAQVRRYALPHEALVGLVVRNMAERGQWTIEQWTSALPPSAAASWVASKVLLKMQKRAEADALADLAIRQGESASPTGSDPAEHRAGVAEALAYRGRWTDSVEHYRQAIDLADDDATRRSWWLNLAELAHRMSDDPAQIRAIEAAKSPDRVDEITQRARKVQESLPALLTPGSRR
jgi:tetratricopeptide (TPR) repeat protein